MNYSGRLSTQDFTTLARVKALINASLDDDSQDTLITSLIGSVSVKFTQYLGVHAVKASRTEVYEVRAGQRVISLDGAPIYAVEGDDVTIKIAYAPTTAAFNAATTLADDEFAINYPAGFIKMLVEQLKDPGFAQVTYTGGLSLAGEIPTDFPDLAFACDMQTKYLLQRHDTLGGQITMQTGASSSFAQSEYGLLHEVRDILEGYRRARV